MAPRDPLRWVAGAFFVDRKERELIRELHERDGRAVAEIFEQGIRTRNATFETEAPSWRAWNAAQW